MLKHEDWTDRFGITWEMGMKGVSPFPKINPLADIEKQLDGYKFPDPNGLVMNPDALSHLKTIDRDKFLVRGYIYYFCFERAWALMGMDNFLTAIIEFPDKVRYILHEIAKYVRVAFDRYLEMGVDAVGFSEDLGTQKALMMSPAHLISSFSASIVHLPSLTVLYGKSRPKSAISSLLNSRPFVAALPNMSISPANR